MDRVWGANKLLEECIEAREQLDLANAKILSARRKHDAMAASPSGRGVRDDNDSEEDAALAAAVPVAREFCDKMADLADVAPGLSSLLAEITEVGLRKDPETLPLVDCNLSPLLHSHLIKSRSNCVT